MGVWVGSLRGLPIPFMETLEIPMSRVAVVAAAGAVAEG